MDITYPKIEKVENKFVGSFFWNRLKIEVVDDDEDECLNKILDEYNSYLEPIEE
jgi:division protein CdvB (Snf7/Vps24/ESCRT-III family)